jgi:hypothetical protein
MNADRAFQIVCLAILLAAGAILAATFAKAHEAPQGWSYGALCCSNEDCQQIPASAVVEGPDATIVTLDERTHKMLTKPMTYRLPNGDRRFKDAPDGLFHACISRQIPNEIEGLQGGHLICLYRPMRGF